MVQSMFNIEIVHRVLQDLSVLTYESFLINLYQECTNNQPGKSLEEKITYYHACWGYTLIDLHQKYSPHNIPNKVKVELEFTPYTHFLAELGADITEHFDLTDDDIAFIEHVFACLGLEGRLHPKEENKINYVLHILLFPPIRQLESFFSTVYTWHAETAKLLLETVIANDVEMPKYQNNFALHFGSRFINDNTYNKLGKMDGLINSSLMTLIASDLLELKESIPRSIQTTANAICPECGYAHEDIMLEHDHIFFMHLLNEAELHLKVGFCLYDEYRDSIINTLLPILLDTSKIINDVKNSKCVILVEGASEENALPIMAIRIGKPLATKNIQVVNCKSKQKVLEAFKLIRDNLPNLSICILLDNDAEKEKQDIEKMIKGHRDRFSLSFIPKGAFEDLIPLPIIAEALNKLYPTENSIKAENFDEKRDIVKQINQILHKFHSRLDKVEFNRTAAELMTKEDVPDLIKDLIDESYKLCRNNK